MPGEPVFHLKKVSSWLVVKTPPHLSHPLISLLSASYQPLSASYQPLISPLSAYRDSSKWSTAQDCRANISATLSLSVQHAATLAGASSLRTTICACCVSERSEDKGAKRSETTAVSKPRALAAYATGVNISEHRHQRRLSTSEARAVSIRYTRERRQHVE